MLDGQEVKGMLALMVISDAWVLAGRLIDDGRESGEALLRDAYVVRTWGTSKGLGELQAAPLSGTALDPLAREVSVNRDAVLYVLKLGKAWGDSLRPVPDVK